MKIENKKIIVDYLNSFDFENVKFKTKQIPVSKITYLKALITFVNELDRDGLLDKIAVVYFMDSPIIESRLVNLMKPEQSAKFTLFTEI